MGLDLGGAMVVGVRLDKEDWGTEVEIESCDHPEAKVYPFCPACGKKYSMRQETVEPDWVDQEKLGPYHIEYGTDHEWLVVGTRVVELKSEGRIIQGTWKIPTPPFVSERTIRELLAAYGIKNDKGEFGYWLSIYASY